MSFRFLGIPYANPVKRFEYSSPYTLTSPNTIPASFYGSACPQASFGQPMLGQEDCLFINIYTPYIPQNPSSAQLQKKLKPVIVWIHGGGFTMDWSDSPIYDSGNMASRNDIVHVSFNYRQVPCGYARIEVNRFQFAYRLGTLGFLALDDAIINGNFGIGDQVTALQWIQTNIAAFGGDPSRVTIYGESAGGASVRALLSSPPAIGLFSAAIAQSPPGGFYPTSLFMDFQSVADEYNTIDAPFIKNLGCTGNTAAVLKCLRALPVEKIIANSAMRFVILILAQRTWAHVYIWN